MSAVEVFQFPATGHAVRTVVVDDEPWFVAKDVCTVLGIVNGRDAVSRLDTDEVGTTDVIDSMGRMQRASTVSEAGLYGLIFVSRRAEAKAFKRWVTHEVLPALRRTGRYEVARLGDPLDELELANARTGQAIQIARQERAGRLAAEAHAAELAPRAEAWDVLASAHGDYSVREAAYMLNRDPAIDTGQKRLFALLREWKLIDSRDIPYADHARHVRLRARSYTSPRSGEERTSEQVRITAEGLRYLHRRMGGTGPLSIAA